MVGVVVEWDEAKGKRHQMVMFQLLTARVELNLSRLEDRCRSTSAPKIARIDTSDSYYYYKSGILPYGSSLPLSLFVSHPVATEH